LHHATHAPIRRLLLCILVCFDHLPANNQNQTHQQLLDEGADLHLVAPKRANGGSPLAEAVAGKHEALVELLLRYGADPFTENRAGKAPLDLALELKAVNILRSFERHALFAGYVNMKVSGPGGCAPGFML
jgi:ankyrin repeat protein